MNTAKISGNWFARPQVINGEGETPSGSFIKEKAGTPDPVQEPVPKLTSNEFWPIDLLLTLKVIRSRAKDRQVNLFIIR